MASPPATGEGWEGPARLRAAAEVAQLVEHRSEKPGVDSSILSLGTFRIRDFPPVLPSVSSFDANLMPTVALCCTHGETKAR